MAEVWIIDTDLPALAVDGCAALLDAGEARRAERLRDASDRARFIVVHGAVRQILAGYLDVDPRDLVWRSGPNGKPALDEAALPGVRKVPAYNYSESAGVAMLAVSEQRAVGVDVQRVPDPRTALRMAARYFDPAEARFVAQAVPRLAAERFARLWSRKEAWTKSHGARLGQGVGLPVRTADGLVVDPHGRLPGVCRLSDLPAPPGFCAAVALRGAAPFDVRMRRWARAVGGHAGP